MAPGGCKLEGSRNITYNDLEQGLTAGVKGQPWKNKHKELH